MNVDEFTEKLNKVHYKINSLGEDNDSGYDEGFDFDVEDFKFSWLKKFIPSDTRFSVSIKDKDNVIVFYKDGTVDKKKKIYVRDGLEINGKMIIYSSGNYDEDFLKTMNELFLFCKNVTIKNTKIRDNKTGKYIKKENCK